MPAGYEKPDVSIDVVLLTLIEGKLHVALHERPRKPDAGKLALFGGFVHVDDLTETDVEATAFRVLREKGGLRPRYVEQLRTYSGRERDPTRGFTIAISHVALVPYSELEGANCTLYFYDVDALPELAFDHNQQVADAVERVRNKSSYSTLPCWLLPEKFTLTELQQTYEQIFGEKQNRPTFRARLGIIRLDQLQPGEAADEAGIFISTGEYRGGSQRPALLFRVNDLGLFRRASW
jgi:8-oxo-dGTP diphosphatase